MHQNNDFDDFLADLNNLFEDSAGEENNGKGSGKSNEFSFDSIFDDFFHEPGGRKNDSEMDMKEAVISVPADVHEIETETEADSEPNLESVSGSAPLPEENPKDSPVEDERFEAYMRAHEANKQEMTERRKASLSKLKDRHISLANPEEDRINEGGISESELPKEQPAEDAQQLPEPKADEKKKKLTGAERKKSKEKYEPEISEQPGQSDDFSLQDRSRPAPVPGSEESAAEPAGIPQVRAKRIPLVLRILLLLVEFVLILALALYSVMFVLAKGPSDTARRLFVKSVRETSAIGFLANIYLSDEEIAEIESSDVSEPVISMDTSLINIPAEDQKTDGGADAWGFVDEDGDGIVIEEVHGNTFNGYMMIVYDPSRVIMGCDPNSFGVQGYTVEQMVKKFDAVGGINGGGFVDLNGTGNGETPSTVTVYKGQRYYSNSSTITGFAGIGSDHILHVDISSPDDLDKYDIQYGCGYGPVLVVNGEVHIGESWESGLNPRTVIGQRSDGAMLLLVIDGRHVASLGASFEDVAEVMINFGAVNACNMDGGSSSLMYYQSDYVNNKAFVIGVRPVPTTWLVLKEGMQHEYYN